jgi:cytoskeletal protein CcmA (bactofilin family)
LKSLANTDATVGNTAQTLTIQGSAVINGQTLARSNLNVAGNIQTGGSIQTPSITVSGQSNLGTTQINTLQVASTTSIQGTTTVRDLNVSGAASFSGPITASQITVTRLILSGNASLEVPNHISFTGSTPSRTTNATVLGNGGSANISGSDTAGTININSGNNPTPGCYITVRFNQSFPRQPRVMVSPVGSAAGQLQYYVNRDSNGFSLCSVNAAVNNQSFAFDYFVTY